MNKTLQTIAVAVQLTTAVALSSAAQAQPVAKMPPRCFMVPQFESWKAPDPRTIYIRVNLNQYYRLDLAGKCQALMWPSSHLITVWRGSSTVCSGLDWDLKVSQGGVADIPQPCIVKTMTPLSSDEAAAIPKKFKP